MIIDALRGHRCKLFESVVKRCTQMPNSLPPQSFTIGRTRVFPERNVVAAEGIEVRLEPKVMDLLCTLARLGGDVVSRDRLIRDVWDVSFGAEKRLTRAISLLRKALGDEEIIETVPKRGYRLMVKPQYDAETVASSSTENGVEQNDHSIAALPFSNLTADPEQQYFADGLIEELLCILMTVNQLRVASRTAAFVFRDQSIDVCKIGQQLKVAFLLEGSIRKSGDHLRITTHLVRARDGSRVWSQTYDGPFSDIFRLQEDIAQSVSAAILHKVIGSDAVFRIPASPDDPELQLLFLTARARYRSLKLTDLFEAERLLKDVLERDPRHERAVAIYIMTLRQLHLEFGHHPWRFYRKTAREALMRVSGNNNPLAERLAAEAMLVADEATVATPSVSKNGRLMMYLSTHGADQQKLMAAAGIAQSAIDKDPTSVEALEALAYVRMLSGKFSPESNIEIYRRALAIDPMARGALVGLGEAHILAGRMDDALAALQACLRLNPDNPAALRVMAPLHQHGKQLDLAYKAARRAFEIDGSLWDYFMTISFLKAMDKEAVAGELSYKPTSRYTERLAAGCYEIYIGDYEKAFETIYQMPEFETEPELIVMLISIAGQIGKSRTGLQIAEGIAPGLFSPGGPIVDWRNVRVAPYVAGFWRDVGEEEKCAETCLKTLEFLDQTSSVLAMVYWPVRFLCLGVLRRKAEAITLFQTAVDMMQHLTFVPGPAPIFVDLNRLKLLGDLLDEPSYQSAFNQVLENGRACWERLSEERCQWCGD